MNGHRWYLASGIGLSIMLIAVAVIISTERLSYQSKAASLSSGSLISLENSYLFASPTKAKAGGEEEIRVTVYLLSTQGTGVVNHKVDLIVPSSVSFEVLEPMTDAQGRAVFSVAGKTPGTVEVSARVSGMTLPSITLTFQ